MSSLPLPYIANNHHNTLKVQEDCHMMGPLCACDPSDSYALGLDWRASRWTKCQVQAGQSHDCKPSGCTASSMICKDPGSLWAICLAKLPKIYRSNAPTADYGLLSTSGTARHRAGGGRQQGILWPLFVDRINDDGWSLVPGLLPRFYSFVDKISSCSYYLLHPCTVKKTKFLINM